MNLSLQVNGGRRVRSRRRCPTRCSPCCANVLGLTAAKRGCNQGVCGACTVSIDGRPMRACLRLAQGCAGAEVRTLEGLSDDRACRRCSVRSPGAAPSSAASAHRACWSRPKPCWQRNPGLTKRRRGSAFGNLCRCTGYVTIVRAVQQAAADCRKRAHRARSTPSAPASRSLSRREAHRPSRNSSPTCNAPGCSMAPSCRARMRTPASRATT